MISNVQSQSSETNPNISKKQSKMVQKWDNTACNDYTQITSTRTRIAQIQTLDSVASPNSTKAFPCLFDLPPSPSPKNLYLLKTFFLIFLFLQVSTRFSAPCSEMSLSQPPPWQGGDVFSTHPMHVAPMETIPHSLTQRCPTLPRW